MRSLRTYLLLATTAFIILLAMAAAGLVRQAEQAGRAQIRGQLLDTTRALALVVDGRLEGYERLLRALATSDAMRRVDVQELDRQARAALKDENAWITLADRHGRQLVNTRLPSGARLPEGALSESVWRELDTGRSRVCNLAAGLVEHRIVCVDVPVMQDGRAAYLLTVVIRPPLFQRVIDAQRVPKNRYATILDREGRVIWRSIDPDKYVGHLGTPDMLARMKTAPEGVMRSRSLDGRDTEAAYSRSPTSGWTFIIAVPQDELAAGARGALERGAALAVTLLAAAILLALVTARRISGDIAGLTLAAKAIRAGDPPTFAPARFEEFEMLASVLGQAITERAESQERFALAQAVGGIGSWDWDVTRDEGHVSDAYKRMHGLEAVEGPLTFAQVVAVVHPEDRVGYLARLEAARKRPEPSDNAYRVVHPDGSISWISARGRPIHDASGTMIRAVGIVRDVTPEREAEAALRTLNALLERQVAERTQERDRLWALARDPFVVADIDGVWLEASPAWSAILGYPLEDFLGRTSEWLEHPDDVAATRAEDQRLAQGHITERFENRFRARDGSYRWFSWTAVPEGGRFYSVARDITDEKDQAEALRKAELALRESQKLESIGQITGGVAHDFNNLLTPILGALDLLQQRGLPDARSSRMVDGALEAAERARTLVQRLLAFARRQPLRTEPVDVTESLMRMRPLLETTVGPKVRIDFDLTDALPAVLADAQQVELAVLNLAVNARDAMPEGGVLTVRADLVVAGDEDPHRRAPGRYVEISVSDTGVGMPAKVIERAIEPFFSTKGLGQGTGLGLSMVHGLMAQLGGGMRIASALGEGSTIQLWLPVTEAPVPLAQATGHAPGAVASGRVLLVDDEILSRQSTAQMLTASGYEVVEASSASEALRHLATAGFDILVTDHLMPGMSGVELARAARKALPDLRVLIISGYADVDDIAPDLPRLSKPFRHAELLDAITRLTDTRSA